MTTVDVTPEERAEFQADIRALAEELLLVGLPKGPPMLTIWAMLLAVKWAADDAPTPKQRDLVVRSVRDLLLEMDPPQ